MRKTIHQGPAEGVYESEDSFMDFMKRVIPEIEFLAVHSEGHGYGHVFCYAPQHDAVVFYDWGDEVGKAGVTLFAQIAQVNKIEQLVLAEAAKTAK